MLTWLNAPHTQSKPAVISYVKQEQHVFKEKCVRSLFVRDQAAPDVIWLICNLLCVEQKQIFQQEDWAHLTL